MKHINTNTKFFVLSTLLCSSAMAQAQGVGPSALDLSFNGSGRNTHKIGNNGSSTASSVAIQSDGKIVAAGSSNNADFGVARYNTNGQLDSDFGNGGKVSTDMGGADYVRALAIQSDGKIVVVGNKDGNFAVARYKTNGSLDTSFDGDGKKTYSFGGTDESATSVAIQTDGKIVIAGSNNTDGIVTRLNPNGSLDPSFGIGGKVTVSRGYIESFSSVAIQSNGKIVAAGRLDVPLPYSTSVLVTRLRPDGSRDTNFGQNGDVIFSDVEAATGILIHSDGRIVVCGNKGGRYAAVRLFHNGSTDTGFGSPYGYLGGAPSSLTV